MDHKHWRSSLDPEVLLALGVRVARVTFLLDEVRLHEELHAVRQLVRLI